MESKILFNSSIFLLLKVKRILLSLLALRVVLLQQNTNLLKIKDLNLFHWEKEYSEQKQLPSILAAL